MNSNLKYQLKWAWQLAEGFRGKLAIHFLLELLVIASSLYFIILSKQAIDFAIEGDRAMVKTVLIIGVIVVVLGLIFKSLSVWINEKTRINMLIDLQNRLVKSQMLSTWNYIKKWHSGDIQLRINADANEVVQMVGATCIASVLTLIRLVASFFVLWSMDPMLAFIILAITPLFIFSKVYFRRLRSLNHNLKTAESKLAQVVQENLRFRMVIRALGLQQNRWDKIEQQQASIAGLKGDLLTFSIKSQTLLKAAVNFGFLLTFIWGVYKLLEQEITFGMMTAFLQLVGRIQTPVLALMSFVPVFIKFRTSVDRVDELLGTELEAEEQPEILQEVAALHINNLSFQYEDNLIIDNFTMKAISGQPTAIIGSSGKGKTTLIRLLLAMVNPISGQVYLEAAGKRVPLNRNHRVNIAYVPQGDKLFAGTIRENLMIHPEITENKIKEVLYLSCAEFVHQLPEGLDTDIGESGYGLSEGQAQRIALARALLKDATIWLFDEVTSALDAETTQTLLDRLLLAGKDKVVIYVTHDLTVAERCSQVVYMQ